MTPYHTDPWLTVYQGDCREVMAQMEPESVHCVVTSPPYWGLRDYGTATWLGGDDGCDHVEGQTRRDAGRPATMVPRGAGGAMVPSGSSLPVESPLYFKATCGKCGAVRQDSQLGLEPTPEEYVANMVAVFREVRRVLRKDGTCWVNLGDSYGTGASGGSVFDNGRTDGRTSYEGDKPRGRMAQPRIPGLKPKDLVGIPWRVAFALQADGWYLRSDIIWSKPNPMPESVTDRPTKAHEYLFLLTKSPRYYYDADAVREPAEYGRESNFRAPRYTNSHSFDNDAPAAKITITPGEGGNRNLRTVWTIATQPYPGAHFATFPEALVEPCVKAGTSERGVCPECGAPWRRVVDRESVGDWRKDQLDRTGTGNAQDTGLRGENFYANYRPPTTTGWRWSCDPDCTYEGQPVPATVLDPFAGSGTTGRVAQRLGRKAVLIDLSGEYLQQLMVRNADIPLGLAEGSGR